MDPEIPVNVTIITQSIDIVSINGREQMNGVRVEQSIDVELSKFTPALHGEWMKISTVPCRNDKSSEGDYIVTNRIGHACFLYKNSVYFYGGSQIESSKSGTQPKMMPQSQLPQPPILSLDSINSSLNMSSMLKQALWSSFHKFNITNKQFNRQSINFGANSALFSNISQFGWLLLGNSLFLFGGINCETGQHRSSQICSINLQTGSVKRHESKTPAISIPCPRLNPSITSLQKSILLVFGGYMFNNLTETYQFLNDMYIFKIQTKTWVKIEDNLHLKFPVLIEPSLINFNDSSLFLMGGCREIHQNNGGQPVKIFNHEIYRLKIVNKTASSKSDCTVKYVYSTNSIPSDQKLVKVMKYGDKGLFVITASNNITNINHNNNNNSKSNSNVNSSDIMVPEEQPRYYYWYYDVSNLLWLEFKQTINNQLSPSYHTSTLPFINSQVQCQDFIVTNQKLLAFQQNGDVLQYIFSQNTLQCVIQENLAQSKITLCALCEEERLSGAEFKNLISAEYMQEFVSALEFPFAAVGLLVDNAVLANAKVCNIYFNVGSLTKDENNKNVYMIIEDNGQPSRIWAHELKPVDYLNAVHSFSATVLPEDSISEEDYKKMFVKSMKDLEQKQKNLQKQFTIFQKSQLKSNNSNNQSSLNSSYSNIHMKTEKDFQKQHQDYIQKKQRLHHKKKAIQTQARCKKLCNSFKLAGMRLGDFVAYACKQKKNQQNSDQNPTDKEIRRFFIMRKQKCHITGKNCYVCYAFITQNGNAIDHKMQNIMKTCMKEFKREMKILSDRLKTMNNVVLVSEMRQFGINQDINIDKSSNQMVSFKQLRLKKKQNDVFYGQSSILNHLQSNCLNKMSESCDVSLKTYLSLLYLNNDNDLVMNFSVKENQPEEINSQPFLPLIDRLLSSKKIIEVSKILDFSDECSVVEVYWLPDYSSNYEGMSTISNKVNGLGFFLNGILIYHRNRLINRYEIPLGKMFDELEVSHKNGSIFGYLEIKPQYTANIYQTDMFYPRSFQKYYSRLQFIKQFMENKSKEKRGRGRDEHGSGYQKISKRSKNQ